MDSCLVMSARDMKDRVLQSSLADLCACLGMVLVVLSVFRPAYVSLTSLDGAYNLLDKGVVAGLALYALVRHHRPRAVVVAIWLYCLAAVVSSLVNGDLAQWSLLGYMGIALTAYYFQEQFESHPRRVLTVAFWLLALLCLADVASVWLRPDGLYLDVRVQDEYYTASLRGWLLGLKNNHILFFLALVLLSMAKDRYERGTFRPTLRTLLCLIMTLLTVAKMGSSTSTVVLAVVLLMLIAAPALQKARSVFNPKVVCVALLVAWVLVVVFSGLSSAGGVLESVFGKDATLSGRSLAWSETMQMVGQSPVFGHGNQSVEERTALLGSVEYVNSHNQLLEVLYAGGALSLAAFCLVFWCLSRGVTTSQEDYFRAVVIVALGIEMMLEVIAGSSVFWFVVLLAYYGGRPGGAGGVGRG